MSQGAKAPNAPTKPSPLLAYASSLQKPISSGSAGDPLSAGSSGLALAQGLDKLASLVKPHTDDTEEDYDI